MSATYCTADSGRTAARERPPAAVDRLPWFAAVALACGCVFADPMTVNAATPQVGFDVACFADCRDVTTEEFARLHPEERMWSVVLPISTIVAAGEERDIREIVIRLRNSNRSSLIVDFDPKTKLASEVDGNINVEDRRETTQHLGVQLDSNYQKIVKGQGGVDVGSKNFKSLKFARRPEMQVVSTSGTWARGRGVYFKLRPTSQTSLEGRLEFRVVFRTPANWTHDKLVVACEATAKPTGISKSLKLQDKIVAGRAEYVVFLYDVNNKPARILAKRAANAERRLRVLASQQQQQIDRLAYATPIHRVAGFLEIRPPRIPQEWLALVVAAPKSQESTRIIRHLPASVRMAALQYSAARSSLDRVASVAR